MEREACKPGVAVIYWSHRAPNGDLAGVATETIITSHVQHGPTAYVVQLQGITGMVDIRQLVPNSASTF